MIPPIQCNRAAAILASFETGQLAFTADEIEQLLKLGLVVESDPDHLAAATSFQAVREEFAEHFQDPLDPTGYKSALADIEEKLKNEWYRLRTSKARIREHEASRIQLRRALGMLTNPAEVASLQKLAGDAALVGRDARYFACPSLGFEVYAITILGQRVLHDIRIRLSRVSDATLASFMKSFNKADAKMAAFGQEIGFLAQNVGHVKKNPEQVVIGLAKSGLPPDRAIGTYHKALAHTRAADVAVTCARNAQGSGGPAGVSRRLELAFGALVSAGFPRTTIVSGAAKSLLAFDPPHAGVPRFVELYRRLRTTFGDGDHLYKFIVRLMPAFGTPSDVVARTIAFGHALRNSPSPFERSNIDLAKNAVALASMVKSHDALAATVHRFRALEAGLSRNGISSPATADGHALECLACPGTPDEVLGTVRSLCLKIQPTWPPTPATAAIATSFAKRFAY